MSELNIWTCKNCDAKNYFPMSPDIQIMGNKLRIWSPTKGVYEEDYIKCSKCETPYPREPTFGDIIYNPIKKKCPKCGHEYEESE